MLGDVLSFPTEKQHAGNWRDDHGIVHAVNSFGFDLTTQLTRIEEGWETVCCQVYWEEKCPKLTTKHVTCLGCIAG